MDVVIGDSFKQLATTTEVNQALVELASPELPPESCEAVTLSHVIEHVPEPVALLRGIRRSLAGTPRARLFFETPCVEWILAVRQ